MAYTARHSDRRGPKLDASLPALDDPRELAGFDLGAEGRSGTPSRRVNVDFPGWVVEALDGQAERLGVNRQALIKLWIAERLEFAA